MEVAFSAADDFDFAVEKKIQLAGKTIFRPTRTFGDGFDQTLSIRTPMNDQAGFGQRETADETGGCFFQEWRVSGVA